MSAIDNALRIAKESGGPFNLKASPVRQLVKTHTGPIHSAVAGRTDHLPMEVPEGAYVLPADIVSALGEGNTMAGFKVAKSLFPEPPDDWMHDAPYGAKETPGQHVQGIPTKAFGGPAGSVKIVAAGGEHVISPRAVQYAASKVGGSLDDGHQILDHFVKQVRAGTIKKLSRLPGPKKD